MVYTYKEIREAMERLCGGDFPNAKDGYNMDFKLHKQIVDMMDDMLHALEVWDGFAGYLDAHGMLPSTPNAVARFWNRPQDKDNMRVWEDDGSNG